jgi:hypothetical protein
MIDREKGAHEWMIEFKEGRHSVISKVLDETIQSVNSDYETTQ